jgi:hypothetical protein
MQENMPVLPTGTNPMALAKPINGSTHLSDARQEAALGHIREALAGLRYGNIVVLVQDGVVVQIERTEKRRLCRPSSSEPRRE